MAIISDSLDLDSVTFQTKRIVKSKSFKVKVSLCIQKTKGRPVGLKHTEQRLRQGIL